MQTDQGQDFISVKEFIESLDGRLSKNSVYAAIERGDLEAVRLGRRLFLPRDALSRALRAQSISE